MGYPIVLPLAGLGGFKVRFCSNSLSNPRSERDVARVFTGSILYEIMMILVQNDVPYSAYVMGTVLHVF